MRMLLFSFAISLTRSFAAESLRCWHCAGQQISDTRTWLLDAGEDCRLRRTKCHHGAHSCIVAQVKGSQNFSISGCSHDPFIGCDENRIAPYDTTVHRCQCLGNYCNAAWYDVARRMDLDSPSPKREAIDLRAKCTSKLITNSLIAMFAVLVHSIFRLLPM